MTAIKTFDASMTVPQDLGRLPAPEVLEQLNAIPGICVVRREFESIQDDEAELEPFALPDGEWVFAFITLISGTDSDATLHMGYTHADAYDYRITWGDNRAEGPLQDNLNTDIPKQTVPVIVGGRQLYVSLTCEEEEDEVVELMFVKKEIATAMNMAVE